MKPFVKFILMFVLLMLSFSIQGSALNVGSTSCMVCRVSESTANLDCISLHNDEISHRNKLHTLSISDMELGFRPISEAQTFPSNFRMQRIEMSQFLKDIMHKLCLRENLLVLDKSKSYHSDKEFYCARTRCEYYIFALRRILI